MKKLSMDEVQQMFVVLEEKTKKSLKGGCDMCKQWDEEGLTYFTQNEYTELFTAGNWNGGLVCGLGYVDKYLEVDENTATVVPGGPTMTDPDKDPNKNPGSHTDVTESVTPGQDNVSSVTPVEPMGSLPDTSPDEPLIPTTRFDDPLEAAKAAGLKNVFSSENEQNAVVDWFKLYANNGGSFSNTLDLSEIMTGEEARSHGYKAGGLGYFSKEYEINGVGSYKVVVLDSSFNNQHSVGSQNQISRLEYDDRQGGYSFNLKNNDGYNILRINCFGNKELYDYLNNQINH